MRNSANLFWCLLSAARALMRVWTAYELSATISHKCGLGVTVIMHMRRAGQPMASHDLHLSSGDLAKSRLMIIS